MLRKDEAIKGAIGITASQSAKRKKSRQSPLRSPVEPFIAKAMVGNRFSGSIKLVEWLYCDRADSSIDLAFRLAPSIVTRSEAELLGVSSPRFALRVYPGETIDGFFNVRRLAELASSTSDARGHFIVRLYLRIFQPHRPQPMSRTQLEACVLSSACVADSLLSPPRRFAECQFVTAQLGKAYGEGRPVHGIVFLQQWELGGGLCAQSACFMAIASLHQYATSLPSLAELTVLARRNGAKPGPLKDWY